VCSGLAYLTRPEGVELATTVVLFLLVMQLIPSWRPGWKWTLAGSGAVGLATLAIGCPYRLATGHFTQKPSGGNVLKAAGRPVEEDQGSRIEDRGSNQTQSSNLGPSPPGVTLAVWLNQEESAPARWAKGLGAVAGEAAKGFHYYAWLPALLGLGWSRRRLRRRAEAWLVPALCLLHGLVLWRLAMVAGYVSERHVLLLVLGSSFSAVVGMREMPLRLAAWGRQIANRVSFDPRSASAWSTVCLLALVGAGLPKAMGQRLHANRAGHRAAGLWLAEHAGPADQVLDGHFGWACFYAGREFQDPPRPRPSPHTVFVVKGQSRERPNPYGPTNAQADLTVESIRNAGGRIAYSWPVNAPPHQAKVVVWSFQVSQ
jgi:hypothetical protein